MVNSWGLDLKKGLREVLLILKPPIAPAALLLPVLFIAPGPEVQGSRRAWLCRALGIDFDEIRRENVGEGLYFGKFVCLL